MGRLRKQHKRASITVTLDPILLEAIKDLADKQRRSVSMQMEKLMEQALLLKVDY